MILQEKQTDPKGQDSGNILLHVYQTAIEKGEISKDPHQLPIINELQSIYDHLLVAEQSQKDTSLFDFFKRTKSDHQIQKGLYLWGGVGRGKTYLVDLFYNQLPTKKKMRIHFHRFMQLVHEELSNLEGVTDPLKTIAKSFAKKAQLLCLDELHVIDITDAMLLAGLFKALFENGVIIVTTSNFHPDELYKNGLQRERFIPAIELLKKQTTVIEMGGEFDYRRRVLEEIGIYYHSSSINTEHLLEEHFHRLSGINLQKDRTDIIINSRKIPVKMWNTEVAWFSFDALCNTPRSTEDYTQIATYFNTIIISNIPIMDSSMDDAARRFINMIDSFYDMHINIVVSADAEPEGLYRATKLVFEFKRTVSRINEMQSKEYIKTERRIS